MIITVHSINHYHSDYEIYVVMVAWYSILLFIEKGEAWITVTRLLILDPHSS